MQKAHVLDETLKRWLMMTTFCFTKLLSFDCLIYKLWTVLTSGVGSVRMLFLPALHRCKADCVCVVRLIPTLHKNEIRIRKPL